jgi:DNA-binding NtrC family response regulator
MKTTTLVIDEHRETCGLLADDVAATGHGSREGIPHLKKAQPPSAERDSLLGASPAMRAIFALMRRVAGADATVLLSGASGTGKGLCARTLHELGPRGFGPFVAVNCAAVPSELERALFGRAGGAFIAADSGRAGLLERAGAGTLLLDEIGEMPLDMQLELLRALERCRTHHVGSNGVHPRARIIATTTRNLAGEVESKRFREDLFDRLSEVPIALPSLRARGSDVLLLADRFARGFAARSGKTMSGISSEAQRKLLGFDWPGNVSQLESSMEHAVARMRAERIVVEDLPERVLHFERACHAVDDPREPDGEEEPTVRPPVSGRRPPAGSLSRAANRRGYPCFRSPARRRRDRPERDH